MPILPIITYPDPVLKKAAASIDRVDAEVVRLAEDMVHTLHMSPSGVGLAAPQVGHSCRLVVIDLSFRRSGDPEPLILINPEIVEEEGEVLSEEGCLSVPDCLAEVQRALRVRVQALNLQGEPVEIDADDFLAIVLQHEADHLDGTLIIDYVSPLKRQLYRRKIKKALKEQQQKSLSQE
jgi:peptide deformylase